MRTRILALLAAPALAFGIAACDIDQTEEGELPTVDVEGGNLPEYDIDAPDVDINRDTVTVPTIEIDTTDDDTSGVNR